MAFCAFFNSATDITTSFVIYQNTIKKLSSSPGKTNRIVLETTVITHEFGHILGLTNIGTTLQSNHEDPEHKRHCTVNTCLMFWESELGNVLGGNIPKLDAQCIADLQANGGK